MPGMGAGVVVPPGVLQPANFPCVPAMALFGGHRDRKGAPAVVPLAITLLGDAVLRLYGRGCHGRRVVVYLNYAAIVCFRLLLVDRSRGASLGAGKLFAFPVFPAASVWAAGGTDPRTAAGRVSGCIAAIPCDGLTLDGERFSSAPSAQAQQFPDFASVQNRRGGAEEGKSACLGGG